MPGLVKRGALVFATATFLILTFIPVQTAVRPPKLQYKMMTLSNGLRVILSEDHSTPIVHVSVWYHVGSKNEKPGRTGFAHLFEHMMFKGTDTLSAEQVDLAFDTLGAEHNAFTSGEMTAFWGAGLPEVLCDVHDIVADILRPALRQDDFDNEKKVILEEIAMYDDQPFWVLYESAMEQYYGTSSLGHRVLGNKILMQCF